VGSEWGDREVWRKHFPNKGPGEYTVVWRNGGHRVTHRLGFRIRSHPAPAGQPSRHAAA